MTGTLSVKACGGSIPSHYINMNTNSGSYAVAPQSLTGSFTLDAFTAATNVNCTLSSYTVTETTSFTGLTLSGTASSCASSATNCLTIEYPLTTARLTGGTPAPFAYNLIVEYKSINTAAYIASSANTPDKVVLTNTVPGTIEVLCSDKVVLTEPTTLTSSSLSIE